MLSYRNKVNAFNKKEGNMGLAVMGMSEVVPLTSDMEPIGGKEEASGRDCPECKADDRTRLLVEMFKKGELSGFALSLEYQQAKSHILACECCVKDAWPTQKRPKF